MVGFNWFCGRQYPSVGWTVAQKTKKTAKREQEYTNWLDEGRKLRTLRGDELIASFALSYVWLPSPINIDNHLTSSSGATSPPPFFIYTHSACPETCKALSSSPLPGRSCYPPPAWPRMVRFSVPITWAAGTRRNQAPIYPLSGFIERVENRTTRRHFVPGR